MCVAAVAGLAGGAIVVVSSRAAALPPNVVELRGKTSQKVPAAFSYDAKKRTVNGFAVTYTCGGRKLRVDADLYTVADGGNDTRALASVGRDGAVSFSLPGAISRFSEDGPVAKGRGRIVVRARLTRAGRLRVLKGSVRVTSAKCSSASSLTFRVSAVGT
jgi:hypothetical protein